jgi:ABC-type phosphate/phosphonate transport system substrate-binding protein
MRRRAFLGLCGVGVVALLRDSQAVARAQDGITVGLTGTIFPGLSDAMLAMAAKPFRSLLEEATGVSGTVVQGGKPGDLAAKLKKDEVQLGVFQGVEFAWAKVSNPKLEPIVICVNHTRTLKAYLIVRASDKGAQVADLKGKTLVLPTETREHCRAFLECKCVTASAKPNQFYKAVNTAADVEEALDEVCDGNATAAVVDGLAWASYKKGKPGCAKKLRVLEVSEAFPSSVVACQSGRFSAEQIQRFREGLIAAKDSARGKKMMEFLRITGFESVPADFDDLLKTVAKEYPSR